MADKKPRFLVPGTPRGTHTAPVFVLNLATPGISLNELKSFLIRLLSRCLSITEQNALFIRH